jgi:hypothetical protein
MLTELDVALMNAQERRTMPVKNCPALRHFLLAPPRRVPLGIRAAICTVVNTATTRIVLSDTIIERSGRREQRNRHE